jgi:hypothetical protein
MSQQFFLFDSSRTGYVAEDAVKKLLENANPLLWQVVMYPWEDFQFSRRDDPRFQFFSEGETAWWMHCQIKNIAQTLCEDCPELDLTAHTTRDNQFYLMFREELILVFKKLKRVYSRKLMRDVLVRSNYPTRHNREFWAQRREAGLDAPRIIVGYEPIRALTEARIHIGYPRSKGYQFDWVYEMPNQFEAARSLFRQQFTAVSEEASPERRRFMVIPRPAKANERGA